MKQVQALMSLNKIIKSGSIFAVLIKDTSEFFVLFNACEKNQIKNRNRLNSFKYKALPNHFTKKTMVIA